MTKRDVLDSALRKNSATSIRAEDLKEYEDFFVETVDCVALESNENQLIFGRRGSGKTLLFGTLDSRINSGSVPRVASFNYTVSDFTESLQMGSRLSVGDQANVYFHSLIERLSQSLFDYVAATLESPSRLRELGLAGAKRQPDRKHLADCLLRLIDAAAVGAQTLHKTQVSEMRLRLGELVEGESIDRETLSEIIRAGAEEDLVTARYAEFNPTRVKELLIEIVETLGLNYIVVFVDEWMHLKEFQVEFAERLRQCLFGTGRISVKIAADQYQGKFNNSAIGPGSRGLEIGADIMVKVDLDHSFRGPNWTDLYSEALYRRFLHLEPELSTYFGEPPLASYTRFILALFHNQNAFEEVCRGAQGLCREFHDIVKLCGDAVGKSVAKQKIDFPMVQRVLVDRTKNVYKSIKNPASNSVFVDLIVPHVTATGSQYFLADVVDQRYRHIIDYLHSRRVIHGVPMSEQLDPQIKAKYEIYEIEYGIYLEVIRTARYTRQLPTADLGDITTENCDAYTLNFDKLDLRESGSGALVRCVECGHEFSRHDQYYSVAGVCPNPSCLAPQPDWLPTDSGDEEE